MRPDSAQKMWEIKRSCQRYISRKSPTAEQEASEHGRSRSTGRLRSRETHAGQQQASDQRKPPRYKAHPRPLAKQTIEFLLARNSMPCGDREKNIRHI